MKLAAIVLAAGASSRFGGNKLSAPFRGEPLLSHAIRAARAAPAGEVVVVTKADQPVGEWRGAPPVRTIAIHSEALSDSLKAGIAAAGDVDGAFIFLGDMPLVPPEVAARLAGLMGRNYAALPRHAGKQGHPVLLSRRAFDDVAKLTGDSGAGRLLRQRKDIALLDWPDDRIHLDVDQAADLARIERRLPPVP